MIEQGHVIFLPMFVSCSYFLYISLLTQNVFFCFICNPLCLDKMFSCLILFQLKYFVHTDNRATHQLVSATLITSSVNKDVQDTDYFTDWKWQMGKSVLEPTQLSTTISNALPILPMCRWLTTGLVPSHSVQIKIIKSIQHKRKLFNPNYHLEDMPHLT